MVHVLTTLEDLKGTVPKRGAAAQSRYYNLAKKSGNYDIAAAIVERCARGAALDGLVREVVPFVKKGLKLTVVAPSPSFDDQDGGGPASLQPRAPNALPYALAAYLARALQADIDVRITQIARVGRSTLERFPRFLCQPHFQGAVQNDTAYILADDVITTGGTLAALRSYIILNQGVVASAVALAHGSGVSRALAMTNETWNELCTCFGNGLSEFWRREIGHDAQCLTNAEGRFLSGWIRSEVGSGDGQPPLQRLRDRLLEAAAKGE